MTTPPSRLRVLTSGVQCVPLPRNLLAFNRLDNQFPFGMGPHWQPQSQGSIHWKGAPACSPKWSVRSVVTSKDLAAHKSLWMFVPLLSTPCSKTASQLSPGRSQTPETPVILSPKTLGWCQSMRQCRISLKHWEAPWKRRHLGTREMCVMCAGTKVAPLLLVLPSPGVQFSG